MLNFEFEIAYLGENVVEDLEASTKGWKTEIGERERGNCEGIGRTNFEPCEEFDIGLGIRLNGLGFGLKGLGLRDFLAFEKVPRVSLRLLRSGF